MDGIIDLVCELKKKCVESDTQFSSELNLSDSEYNFIKALINCKDLESSSIAEKMNISLSRVSRIIEKMVKHGYIKRTINESDRRGIKLEITAKGEQLKQTVIAFRMSCEKRITEALEKEEVEALKRNLLTIIDIL